MAVREAPPPGLLASFSAPLWERLHLEEMRPLWIVTGQHRGYDWMAIELEHQATGLLMGSERVSDTTTFFVMRLPRKSCGWYLPAHRITSVQQVCVDDECVYVAALGQQPRVRDWRRWLDITANAADEVVQTEGSRRAAAPAGGVDEEPESPEPEPSWNPHDDRWAMSWLMVALALGGIVLLFIAMDYSAWRDGSIVRCDEATHTGTVLRGWKLWLHVGILAIPLVGIGRLLHTMSTRIHRPGFALQINVEGVLLVACSLGLAHALAALEKSARAMC